MGVTTPGNKPKFEGVREVLKDPNWWMRDVFTALVVAVVVSAGAIMGQKLVELHRAGADFAYANLAGALLVRTDLSRADLTGADLSHANLTEANLARANVTDVFYDAATVGPKGFPPPPSRAAP